MYGDIYVLTDKNIPESNYQAREVLVDISHRETDGIRIEREFKMRRVCPTHLVRLERRNWEFFCPMCEIDKYW